MRVALIAPLFESVPPRLYGGTERVVSNLCRGLNDANIEVTVFASGDSSVDGRLVPVIDEALRLRKKPVSDPVPYYLKMMAEVAARADEFDVIHNHHDYWMLPLTCMTRVPLLTTLHGRLDLPDLSAAMAGFPEARYVSISDAQRAPLPGLPWVRTIHHGIDLSEFRFNDKPGNYLAFLGRITADKRPEWAIEIAQRSGIPLKIAAKIEGKDGQDYYDQRVRPHVDGKFIEYVGEITDSEKSDFLGRALGMVFPIDWPEPFGLVMIEALACGTPVLARPCGSVPEILEDGITGFSHMNIQSLADRAKDLARISRRGCRKWAEDRFSLSRMTGDYIHVYRYLTELANARRQSDRAGRAGRDFGPDRRRRDFLHPLERLADGNN